MSNSSKHILKGVDLDRYSKACDLTPNQWMRHVYSRVRYLRRDKIAGVFNDDTIVATIYTDPLCTFPILMTDDTEEDDWMNPFYAGFNADFVWASMRGASREVTVADSVAALMRLLDTEDGVAAVQKHLSVNVSGESRQSQGYKLLADAVGVASSESVNTVLRSPLSNYLEDPEHGVSVWFDTRMSIPEQGKRMMKLLRDKVKAKGKAKQVPNISLKLAQWTDLRLLPYLDLLILQKINPTELKKVEIANWLFARDGVTPVDRFNQSLVPLVENLINGNEEDLLFHLVNKSN
jgi:hypothetical protein